MNICFILWMSCSQSNCVVFNVAEYDYLLLLAEQVVASFVVNFSCYGKLRQVLWRVLLTRQVFGQVNLSFFFMKLDKIMVLPAPTTASHHQIVEQCDKPCYNRHNNLPT